jgi:hypothetical protein
MFELDVHMIGVWIFCSLRHMQRPFVGFDAVTRFQIFPCAKSMSLGHPLSVKIPAGDRQLAATTGRTAEGSLTGQQQTDGRHGLRLIPLRLNLPDHGNRRSCQISWSAQPHAASFPN